MAAHPIAGWLSYNTRLGKMTAATPAGDQHTGMKSKSVTSPENSPEPPAAGKGIPVPNASLADTQQPLTDRQTTLQDSAQESALRRPSDRDESPDMTGNASPDPMVKQAAADLANGLQDTSYRQETHRAYERQKKND